MNGTDHLSDIDFGITTVDHRNNDFIRREFDDTLFAVEHELSDLDRDDVDRNELSDPDDDPDIELTLDGCPFDIDELLDQVY